MLGRDVVANISVPKTRSVITAEYTYTAIAETPNTKVTDAKWALMRMHNTTTDIDWVRDASGNNTNAFAFTAISIDEQQYDEV